MKIRYSIIFLIFVCNIACAQSYLDSLFSVWKDSTQPDSARAEAFKDYIDEGFFYSDTDSAIVLTNQLYQFSEKTNYQKGMVDPLSELGYAYFRMGDYPRALEFYKKGLYLAEKENDKAREHAKKLCWYIEHCHQEHTKKLGRKRKCAEPREHAEN